ncbi:MAG: universal stress protein [Bacteroidota bacterium]
MKKIIAPVDFSAVSKNAALYAANMAAFLNIPLVVMHVTELPISYAEVPTIPISNVTLMDDDSVKLQEFVTELDKKLMGQVTIETINRTGNPLYEISSYCNRLKPYALVIGTHGNGSFTRFLLGSNTLGLIRDCSSPIVIVPNGFEFKKPLKIGLASDLHEVATCTPAEQIRTLVEDLGSKLVILHVDKNGEEDEDEILAETRQLNNMFVEQHPKIKILKSVFTEETLLNYAAENQLDLLIVVPKKHSWIDSLIKHQHTKNIALHAPVPVMVLKPTQ